MKKESETITEIKLFGDDTYSTLSKNKNDLQTSQKWREDEMDDS